jgi:glycosyltransferase involved in cell wall biosynthesis
METSPLFSVATVTLNCRSDAIRTATSVWNQSFRDYEYIVKDGGSIDGTVDELRKAEHPVSIVIASDKGIYDAMNQAVELCKGKYILFLNGGDTFRDPEALRRMSETVIRADYPEVAYSYNFNVLRQAIVKYPDRLGRFYLFRRSVNHQATYVRRDCFERHGGFDPAFSVLADNELLARLLLGQRYRSALCPVATVDYKDGGSSTLDKNRRRASDERAMIRRKYFSARERIVFGVLHSMLLPDLRSKWLNEHPNTPISRLYYRVANAFNQTLGRG